ncbi:hypothetical protein LWI29_033338 [Acer saccharum]|uniref:Uncharacterized protein n=1 Tax=Acer saccharum TaxID=4024 RepID=A0AA39RLA0_ACESA|nr:hypothetical protein LWI29_033338 [Acer saccharum]
MGNYGKAGNGSQNFGGPPIHGAEKIGKAREVGKEFGKILVNKEARKQVVPKKDGVKNLGGSRFTILSEDMEGESGDQDANHAQASRREQEEVLVCEICNVFGHKIECCSLRVEFSEFYRQHAQTLKSYSLESTNTFGDFYNPEPHYKPYNNSYNQDWRAHQDFSMSYDEINSFEQPTSSCQPMFKPIEKEMKEVIEMSKEVMNANRDLISKMDELKEGKARLQEKIEETS